MPDVFIEPDERYECELPGAYHTRIPGILAWLEQGHVAVDASVERCDCCEQYASDAEAEPRAASGGNRERLSICRGPDARAEL
jgi:hypothetical protein